AWGAVWCKKAKSRSAPPIVISKAAWAIAMRTCIWVRPPSSSPAHWPDLFVRQKISRNAPRAPLSDVPKANRNRPRLWKSWPVFRQACVFECPELVTHLRTIPRMRDAPTTVGQEITIDYAGLTITVDGNSFSFPPLSPAAQELIVARGAEKLVASRLRRSSAEE